MIQTSPKPSRPLLTIGKQFAQNLVDPSDVMSPALHQYLHSYKSLLGDKGLQLVRKEYKYRQYMEAYEP